MSYQLYSNDMYCFRATHPTIDDMILINRIEFYEGWYIYACMALCDNNAAVDGV